MKLLVIWSRWLASHNQLIGSARSRGRGCERSEHRRSRLGLDGGEHTGKMKFTRASQALDFPSLEDRDREPAAPEAVTVTVNGLRPNVVNACGEGVNRLRRGTACGGWRGPASPDERERLQRATLSPKAFTTSPEGRPRSRPRPKGVHGHDLARRASTVTTSPEGRPQSRPRPEGAHGHDHARAAGAASTFTFTLASQGDPTPPSSFCNQAAAAAAPNEQRRNCESRRRRR